MKLYNQVFEVNSFPSDLLLLLYILNAKLLAFCFVLNERLLFLLEAYHSTFLPRQPVLKTVVFILLAFRSVQTDDNGGKYQKPCS